MNNNKIKISVQKPEVLHHSRKAVMDFVPGKNAVRPGHPITVKKVDEKAITRHELAKEQVARREAIQRQIEAQNEADILRKRREDAARRELARQRAVAEEAERVRAEKENARAAAARLEYMQERERQRREQEAAMERRKRVAERRAEAAKRELERRQKEATMKRANSVRVKNPAGSVDPIARTSRVSAPPVARPHISKRNEARTVTVNPDEPNRRVYGRVTDFSAHRPNSNPNFTPANLGLNSNSARRSTPKRSSGASMTRAEEDFRELHPELKKELDHEAAIRERFSKKPRMRHLRRANSIASAANLQGSAGTVASAAAPQSANAVASAVNPRYSSRPLAPAANLHCSPNASAKPRRPSAPVHKNISAENLGDVDEFASAVYDDFDEYEGVSFDDLDSSQIDDIEAIEAAFVEEETASKKNRRATTEDTSNNNSSYILGGRSPFINTENIVKRPLSGNAGGINTGLHGPGYRLNDNAPSKPLLGGPNVGDYVSPAENPRSRELSNPRNPERNASYNRPELHTSSATNSRYVPYEEPIPHKTLYARRLKESQEEKDDLPTMVVADQPSKSSGIALTAVVLLTIVLGAVVGVIIYLALFQ